MTRCLDRVITGPRVGAKCGFATSVIIHLGDGHPFTVCGYHARQFAPGVQHPMDWNLARIRAWRLDNLNRLENR